VDLATIRDVAKLAGVSPSTVSRVLNDSPRAIEISVATRERIWSAARQLRYTPNMMARNLRMRESKQSVGFLYRHGRGRLFAEPFFLSVFEGISVEIGSSDYDLVFVNYEQLIMPSQEQRDDHQETNPVDLTEVSAQRLIEYSIAGLIVLGYIQDWVLAAIRKSGIPTVFIFPNRPVPGFDRIDIDNGDAILKVIEYLHSLGHREIGFLSGSQKGFEHPAFLERKKAFLKANSISCNDTNRIFTIPDWALVTRGEQNWTATLIADLKEFASCLTAIIAANDFIALWAMKVLQEESILVPEVLSIVGFDDIDIAHLVIPGLTTVQIRKEEIGREAVRMLSGRLSEPDSKVRTKLVPTDLVRRESTQPR
jgi:LacI family transcriptional regulator